jgi:hypothetical protein
MTRFTRAQVEQLLKPINSRRVLRDGKGHSHVSQQDVTAHLIRMFGFGGFDVEITGPELVFAAERVNDKTGEPNGRWDVCYRAMCRLTVKDQHGQVVAVYEDGSTATAQNQARGDAHDLAYKSAISLSKKRAAINLGDQFGLSLYNKGQLTPLVMGTLVMPDGQAASDDIQDGVEQQVSLGNDEVDHEPEPAFEQRPAPAAGANADPAWVKDMESRIQAATGHATLTALAQEISARKEAGGCDAHTEARLWALGLERQRFLDAIPRNKDGSVSRSRATDEQLAAIGSMTKEEKAAHGELERSGAPAADQIQRLNGADPNDPWAAGTDSA